MLRDILKKVKSEIGEGKKEREEMEESILVLIEKICDKAMEEAGMRWYFTYLTDNIIRLIIDHIDANTNAQEEYADPYCEKIYR